MGENFSSGKIFSTETLKNGSSNRYEIIPKTIGAKYWNHPMFTKGFQIHGWESPKYIIGERYALISFLFFQPNKGVDGN